RGSHCRRRGRRRADVPHRRGSGYCDRTLSDCGGSSDGPEALNPTASARADASWTGFGPASITPALLMAPLQRGFGAQVAQLVEHVTENHGVGGSIPPLGTRLYSHSGT